MSLTYNLLMTCFILLCSTWIWNRRKYYYMALNIKGPTGIPFIGVAMYCISKKNLLSFIDMMHEEYGKYFLFFLGLQPFLLVADPVMIEEIYNSETQKMDVYDPVKSFLGDGLFTSSNGKWMHNRKIINKIFSKKILINFFPIFNIQGKIVANQILKKHAEKGGECNILDELLTSTLYTTMIATMGNEKNDFESTETLWFVNMFKSVQNIIAERMYDPVFNAIFPWHPTKWKFDQLKKDLFTYVDDNIRQRFKMISANEDTIDENHNQKCEDIKSNISQRRNIFIDHIYDFYKNGELTWEDVQAEAATMIAAAFETTAYTLFNCLLLLAMNSKYQDILYKEIISICPEDDIDITYEHIQQMPYTERVLYETMRLISTVPMVGRKITKDMTLKNGLFIAKGTNILLDIFHLHRDKEIWGQNVLDFNPDNFLKENISKKHSYSYVPFTKGTRNCVGWRYGMFSLQILLVYIIHKYEIKTKWKLEDLEFVVSVTIGYNEQPTLEFISRNKN